LPLLGVLALGETNWEKLIRGTTQADKNEVPHPETNSMPENSNVNSVQTSKKKKRNTTNV